MPVALALIAAPASAQIQAQPVPDDPDNPLESAERPESGEVTHSATANMAQATRQVSGPNILVIVAHPDDELFFAPVLARAARSGGKVTLAFATSGDAGPGVSELEPGPELAALREDEARCSAYTLGASQALFWQMGDGTLALDARKPDSPMRSLKLRIAELIEEIEPNVVISWGPDGGYGHSDHRAVNAAVTEVVQAMDDGRPDLLYPALPASEDTPSELDGWAKTHPTLITDRLTYEREDLDAMRAAANCYESQFDASARAALPELLHGAVWRGNVFFRLAFSRSN
ncbi:hypothetical protein CD351_03350 [Erythrobacter sp. KY5]|nr:hypothetical protein CD351_03350 [Erythrobacter sp. KY5]